HPHDICMFCAGDLHPQRQPLRHPIGLRPEGVAAVRHVRYPPRISHDIVRGASRASLPGRTAEIPAIGRSARTLRKPCGRCLVLTTAVRPQVVQPDQERLQRGPDRRSEASHCQTLLAGTVRNFLGIETYAISIVCAVATHPPGRGRTEGIFPPYTLAPSRA